ncbi:gamma-Glu-GABA hydrolase [Mesorhizobium metallidurans STM 2683]|uniref:gamma-glutamyl-gamma-aminobutyrate hydrolase n=1 Tax=Mesorhizobium metallidurans STM 2683 TaxID=1297569 RepID=M5EZC9_9HYPH|nr:gamma-glutamyl-gamma-aminobutyrate hydrolase family protein [Mesorhizobium metallidurans]CCV09418.1 gamma-Glu-GABA hydrolase [Mesorhizobium metallidurans STM 2683]
MKPIVGIVADRQRRDNVDYDNIRVRYLEALRESAGVLPVVIPTDLGDDDLSTALQALHGLVLGGAVSNVHPQRYASLSISDTMLFDPARDSSVFAAIKVARAKKLPILGICRGLQELNVAFGGTLDQDLSDDKRHQTHFEDESLPRDCQYRPVHDVLVAGEGNISACVRRLGLNKIEVNSLHRQGISRLADGLSADLVAEDGVIEAISATDSEWFVSAVQWHPEWFHREDALSRAIFASFGQACRHFAERSKILRSGSMFEFANNKSDAHAPIQAHYNLIEII